jgi:aldehyde:ferredoxin oxidoreductase
MYGYHGKLLRLDLTQNKVTEETIEETTLKSYLGGAGLAASFLYNETSANTDPLDSENVLIAMTGPFTGSRVPASARHHIMALSPLTGVMGESNVGGSWAVHFKRTGFDGIVVTGRSKVPVYIWIHDDGVEIRNAEAIWGEDTYDSADWLKSKTSKNATVAVIGQAGERLARVASISHIGKIVRSAGRTGMGAVMGSKNLKAMVVYGTKSVDIAHAEELKADIKEILPHIKSVTSVFTKFGTSGGVENYEKVGSFPVKNWGSGRFEEIEKISGSTLHDTVLTGREGCLGCPLTCGRHVKIDKPPYGPLDCAGPEFETLGTMGAECLVSDLDAICKANDLCNRYGLDTMSTGGIIAFAMELYEKGILTKDKTDGLELTWGNGDTLIALVRKIGERDGIGHILGEGSQRAAEIFGNNAEEYAITVKGLEPSAHDPRRFWSQALSYATASRGACHNASWGHAYEMALSMPEIGVPEPFESFQEEGLPQFTATLQDYMSANDTLIICRFSQIGKAVTATNLVNWLNMITGWKITIEEFMEIGERIFNLKRLINTRMGTSRKDDILPPRFRTLKRPHPELNIEVPPLGRLLGEYYKYRDWDEIGRPTVEKLTQLGIEV